MNREDLETRRQELERMLEVARGRLAADLEAVEQGQRLVAQIEGGIVETDGWISRLDVKE